MPGTWMWYNNFNFFSKSSEIKSDVQYSHEKKLHEIFYVNFKILT